MRTLLTLVLAAALGSGPAFAQGGFLGLNLTDSDAPGAVVDSVQERSAASIAGLRSGDRITRVDAIQVADSGALAALIGGRLPGEIVELRVVRGDQVLEQLVVLGRRPGAARSGGGGPSTLPGANPRELSFEWRPESSGAEAWSDPDSWPIPEFQFDAFQPRLEELERRMELLRLRQQEMFERLEPRLRDSLDQFRRELPELHFRIPGPGSGDAGAEVRTRVHLRYPESTPAEQRDRLRADAVEKYGAGVEVEFAGTGTSVTIERSVTHPGAGAPLPAVPGRPGAGGEREF